MKINVVEKTPRKYLTLKQVAEYLGQRPETVSRNYPGWVDFGVKAYRFGRNVYFKKAQIDRMIEMHAIT